MDRKKEYDRMGIKKIDMIKWRKMRKRGKMELGRRRG